MDTENEKFRFSHRPPNLANARTSAEVLTRKIPEIMDLWEKRARQIVSTPQSIDSPVLRDALPRFLASLAAVLATEGRTKVQIEIDAAEILNSSQEHGHSRATISFYLMPQLITEYKIMRQVIFEFLEQEGALNQHDRDIIIDFTEDAVNVAASEFAKTIKEAQDQFTANVAHDLRSPLAAVRAMAEISVKKLGTVVKSNANSSLQDIEKEVIPLLKSRQIAAIDRLNGMIERILDVTKIQAGEPLNIQFKEFNLQKMVLDIASDQKLVHGDYIQVIADEPIIGMWDSEFLHRCIENVIENGFKYGTPGTSVTITLRQTGEMGVIEVHNQGTPIPVEDQAKLFKLHWRSSRATHDKRGWGFGLAFVRGVVEAHHGSIRVESSEGKGTTFILALPKYPKMK